MRKILKTLALTAVRRTTGYYTPDEPDVDILGPSDDPTDPHHDKTVLSIDLGGDEWIVPLSEIAGIQPTTNPFTRCDMCGRDCQTMARLVEHVAKCHRTKGSTR